MIKTSTAKKDPSLRRALYMQSQYIEQSKEKEPTPQMVKQKR